MTRLLRLEEFDRATWLRLERVVEQFEHRWRMGDRPVIADYITSSAVTNQEERLALLLELACIDMEHRMHAGVLADPEEYIREYPDLSGCPQACDELRQTAMDQQKNSTVRNRFRSQDSTPKTATDPPAVHRPPPDSLPTFGNYTDLQEIGRGGMAVVYKARQPRPNRIVALKMIRMGRLASPEERERFRREAEAVGKLQHPHIVPIYEISELDGQPYFTMEFVDGQCLDEMVRHHPLKPRQAARYIEQTAKAIQYAHQQGVLHRDLKPANILIDSLNRPRVTDFGLAYMKDEASSLTVTKVAIGTPAYMPPEQTGSKDWGKPGPHSDIYSLGATLYHLIVGHPPFQAATSQETVWQVLHEEPVAPRLLNPKLDRDLETICLKCLQKDPQQRYVSIQDMHDDLMRYLEGLPIQARPISRVERTLRWIRKNKLVASLLILSVMCAMGVSLAAYAFKRMESETRSSLVTSNMRQGVKFGREGRSINALHMLSEAYQLTSPDSELRDRLLSILSGWKRSLGTCLFHGKPVIHVALSSNAKIIATQDNSGEIRLWDATTGNVLGIPMKGNQKGFGSYFGFTSTSTLLDSRSSPARLFDIQTGLQRNPSWLSEQTTSVMFHSETNVVATGDLSGTVRLWNRETEKPLGRPMTQEGTIVDLEFSPDSRQLFIQSQLKDRRTVTHLWNLETFNRLDALSNADEKVGSITAYAFSQDSQKAVVGRSDGSIQVWDCEKGERIDQWSNRREKVSLLNIQILLVGDIEYSLIASNNSDSFVRLDLLRKGHERKSWGKLHTGFITTLTFQENGHTLLATSDAGEIELWDIRLGKASSGKPALSVLRKEVWLQPLSVNDAVLSSDGSVLVTADASGMAWLWALPKAFKQSLYESPVRAVCYSPNGKWLANGCDDGRVFLSDSIMENRRELTERFHGPVVAVSFSDDSKTIRAVGKQDDRNSDRYSGGSVRTWDVVTGKPQGKLLRVDPLKTSVFSPDGQLLAIGLKDINEVQIWNLESGQRLEGTLPHEGSIRCMAFSPDSKFLLTGCADKKTRLWDWRTCKSDRQIVHSTGIDSVAFPFDGTNIATGTERMRFWDSVTGQLLQVYAWENHTGILAIAFSRDNKSILSADANHTVRLWDTVTGLKVRSNLYHQTHRVNSLAVSPDGKNIFSGSGTQVDAPEGALRFGHTYLWDFPPELMDDPHRIELWIEASTGHTWDSSASVVKRMTFEQWNRKCKQLNQMGGSPIRVK